MEQKSDLHQRNERTASCVYLQWISHCSGEQCLHETCSILQQNCCCCVQPDCQFSPLQKTLPPTNPSGRLHQTVINPFTSSPGIRNWGSFQTVYLYNMCTCDLIPIWVMLWTSYLQPALWWKHFIYNLLLSRKTFDFPIAFNASTASRHEKVHHV